MAALRKFSLCLLQAEAKAEEAIKQMENLLTAWLPHWLEQRYQQVRHVTGMQSCALLLPLAGLKSRPTPCPPLARSLRAGRWHR